MGYDSSTVYMVGTTVTQNIALSSGGGIMASNAEFNMAYCTVNENQVQCVPSVPACPHVHVTQTRDMWTHVTCGHT
jgi:hypothetical protein